MEDFDINNKVGQVCLTIVKKLDFKDIKFPIKVRDIHKIEKKKKKKNWSTVIYFGTKLYIKFQ